MDKYAILGYVTTKVFSFCKKKLWLSKKESRLNFEIKTAFFIVPVIRFYNALALAGDADVLVSTVSAFPNGLSFAKSIRIGAATKIDE